MFFVDVALVCTSCCKGFAILAAFVLYLGTVGVNVAMIVLYGGLYHDIESINKTDV